MIGNETLMMALILLTGGGIIFAIGFVAIKLRNMNRRIERMAMEAVWGEVFNNTITESKWLKHKTFSPGRWAAGYQMLYIMYRVLDEVKPQSILELGLGQTTRMTAQYAAEYDQVQHTVVEHNKGWIKFFKRSYEIPDNTTIIQLEREYIPYKEYKAVLAYKGFDKTFEGKKFDFIIIDSPQDKDMKEYTKKCSRIDLLSILPGCLSHDFVIIVDDSDRRGEKRALVEIERVLKENGIEYARSNYLGAKGTTLICNKGNSFLTSL